MTEPDAAPVRPPQVMAAGVIATATCALMVVTLFHDLAGHDEMDVRRVLTFASGGLAAAGAVLGVFVLQRHRGALVGLNVVATLLLFTGVSLVFPLPLLVLGAALRLWGRDSRDWFAGRPPRDPRPGQLPWPGRDDRAGSDDPTNSQQRRGPANPSTDAAAPSHPVDPWVREAAPTDHAADHAAHHAADRQRRPSTVTNACVLTWVLCGIAAVAMVMVAGLLTGDTPAVVAELRSNPGFADSGLSESQVIAMLWVVAAVGFTWSLAAIGLAVLAYLRNDAARIGLVVSAVLAALCGIAMVPVGWLNAIGAVVTAVLLLRRPSQDWYAGRGSAPSSAPSEQGRREDRPLW